MTMRHATAFSRPTWAEIDIDALKKNFRAVKAYVQPIVKIMVTVKANAYGHGIVPVSKALSQEGVDCFGVASLDEAVTLRKNGLKEPIVILGNILPEEIPLLVKHKFAQVVSSLEMARAISRRARRKRTRVCVHVKIDTGMGRIGFWHAEALRALTKIAALRGITIEGICTHFPSADEEDTSFTSFQIETFNALMKDLRERKIEIPYQHAANSIGLLRFTQSHCNMVRPGLVIYGLYPKENIPITLEPVMSLKTKIVFVKDVPAGRTISYGRTYVTQKPTRIATIPIGYGDGYLRALSNKAHVLVKGKRAPVVGRICMDQAMIDIGGIKNVKIGDEVVLFGTQGKERISVEEIARLAGTIPYEIVCLVSPRVPRVYLP
jgi:alanine racemase